MLYCRQGNVSNVKYELHELHKKGNLLLFSIEDLLFNIYAQAKQKAAIFYRRLAAVVCFSKAV